MTDETEHKEPASVEQAHNPDNLPPAAQRALAEADARRRAETEVNRPKELGGRGGPEPTRYGDWEKDGIAHDF